jgi:hypothetical protein
MYLFFCKISNCRSQWPRSLRGVGLSRLDTGIVGSNPAQDMDISSHFSVLCCPVSAETLRLTDPPTRPRNPTNCRKTRFRNFTYIKRPSFSKNRKATAKKDEQLVEIR